MDELAELSIASRFLPIPLLQMITSILASITFVEVYSLRINSNNVVNIIESLYICKFKDYSRLVKAIITHQWDTEYKLLFLLPIAIEAPYPDEAANDARMFLSEHLDELLKILADSNKNLTWDKIMSLTDEQLVAMGFEMIRKNNKKFFRKDDITVSRL